MSLHVHKSNYIQGPALGVSWGLTDPARSPTSDYRGCRAVGALALASLAVAAASVVVRCSADSRIQVAR